MKNLSGKVVLITGGSSGIGRALAVEFAKHECKLFLTGRNIQELEQTALLCRKHAKDIYIEKLDVSVANDITIAIEKVLYTFGKVDILINNAGMSQRSLIVETPIDIDRKLMEVNYFGTIALTKALLPNFEKIGGGHIVVISSMVGLFGFNSRSAYAASKHALHGFFETLQIEQPIKNLYTTIICPGRIKTNISLSAITATGQAHGQMDEGQLNGIPVEICAQKIIKVMHQKKYLYIIAREEKWLWLIKRLYRNLFIKIARKLKTN
ncbi:MAG: SDR family oxidoreductase [Bacteroidota bacterium]|nr:SDR family oxidoreductase [Bacteroidota bacterium]